MDDNEIRVDMRERNKEDAEKMHKMSQLVFEFNHTMLNTDKYFELMDAIFDGNIGTGSYVATPIQGVCFEKVKIGNNVFINSNALMMARGGITIDDNVQIAANCQLLTNNHDMYDRQILTCKPITIKKGAWIGAGATILPGITIGRHAIVGAAAVVTHDVPDCAVVCGNPARIIKTLDKEKFE